MAKMLKSKTLAASIREDYLEEHSIETKQIYEKMYEDRHQYQPIMKLLKPSMLITPSTSNVEKGFFHACFVAHKTAEWT